MQRTPHDPASALAIRAHYRQSESRTARLRLLVDTGQALPQLPPDAMRERVLARACAFLAMDHGLIQEWDAEGAATTTARHGGLDRLGNLPTLADRSLRTPCWLELPGSALPSVLQVPLRGADGDTFGMLLLGNSVSLRAPDHEDSESLQLLATLLAAHLQNARLLTTLKTRDKTLSELVDRLLRAPRKTSANAWPTTCTTAWRKPSPACTSACKGLPVVARPCRARWMRTCRRS